MICNSVSLNLLFGREAAVVARGFELQRGMMDLKPVVQISRRLSQKGTVAIGHIADEMRSERSLGCAHRPDMKVVDCDHMRKSSEILADFAQFDAPRDGLE